MEAFGWPNPKGYEGSREIFEGPPKTHKSDPQWPRLGSNPWGRNKCLEFSSSTIFSLDLCEALDYDETFMHA